MTEAPSENLEPEEYEPDEEETAVSGETGTVYERGEPEVTPHDTESTGGAPG